MNPEKKTVGSRIVSVIWKDCIVFSALVEISRPRLSRGRWADPLAPARKRSPVTGWTGSTGEFLVAGSA